METFKDKFERIFKNLEYDSKLDFIVEIIFNLTTYDSDINELLGNKMIKVIDCILNKTTFEYQKDKANYENYLMMVNMSFLEDKLEWGTSIRGAWFDDFKEYEIANIKIQKGQLSIFMQELIDWAK